MVEPNNLGLRRNFRNESWFTPIRQRKIVLTLSIILLLYSASNIHHFLLVKNASLLSFLVWNTCTPISIIAVGTLIFCSQMRTFSSAMTPLLLWFGFGGLFVFWWGWLDPQLVVFMHGHHLAMTAAALYLAKNRWERRGIYVGLVILLLVFISFSILGPYAPQPW